MKTYEVKVLTGVDPIWRVGTIKAKTAKEAQIKIKEIYENWVKIKIRVKK
jgi:hypothetical protein